MRDIYTTMKERGETLHPGQVLVARDILNDGKRVVQSQWGRKAGKTFAVLFLATTYAILNPGAQVWIICPQRKQGKDIYWVSGRLQSFAPQKYIEQLRDTDVTVVFKNGSLVRVDGCENFNALRGINPNLVIYDEFQDHSKEFHVEVMAPNLVAKSASLAVFGTPPSRDCYYVEFRKQLLLEIEEGDTTRAYHEFPSDINPTLDKGELEKIRLRLIRSGDEKIWLREHMAQLVWGGAGAVFIPWNRDKHKKPHDLMKTIVGRTPEKLKWYTVFDPGSMTCFAALFIAYNPNTAEVFILDEIYETNPRNTDAISIWKRSMEKEKELYPNRPPKAFHRIYDEAAAWFHLNLNKVYGMDADFHMSPTCKNKVANFSSKETDCSLIKQVMDTESNLHVSDRCIKLIWEVENYVMDDKGDYPNKHDHLIDCLTYFLKGCNYKFIEKVSPDDWHKHDPLAHKYKQKIEVLKDNNDWADNVVSDSLEAYDYSDYFS